VSLVATPTNALEISVGTDADNDGNLSVGEAAYTFGFDCGSWFERDAAAEAVSVLPQPACDSPARVERVFLLKRRKLKADWNLVKVTRRGTGEIGEFAEVKGNYLGLAVFLR